MYPDDNQGTLTTAWDWCPGWLNYDPGNTDNTNLNLLRGGLLGPYTKNVAIYKCPADLSRNGGLKGEPRVRSISMNQAFRTWPNEHWNSPPWRIYHKTGELVLPAPANLWVIIDENPDSVNDAACAAHMDPGWPSTFWQDGPANYHCGGCGFSFADGHSEIKKWKDPRTLALPTTYTRSFNFSVFQVQNRDIQWVQDRTSARK